MRRLTELRWVGIKGVARQGNGAEIIRHRQIKKQIPTALTPDLDILVFHLTGLFRMLGWRSGRIYHVVWLDPNGELYDH